jgi:RNA polymerase sigma-70 factor (ECF subfamily)
MDTPTLFDTDELPFLEAIHCFPSGISLDLTKAQPFNCTLISRFFENVIQICIDSHSIRVKRGRSTMVDRRPDIMEKPEKGDLGTVEALYDKYAERIYRFLVVMTGSEHAAQDALQEVFLSIVRSRDRLDKVENMTGYLFTCARNAAGRIMKERGRSVSLSELPEPVLKASSSSHPDEAARLSKLMLALPAEQREVLSLKVYQDMTFEEIARITGTSANTAAGRFRYAVAKLREGMPGTTIE